MIAYPDGTPVREGDSVMVEGEHSGNVMRVLDSPEEVAAWGLDEPGLMIDTSFGGLVFYAARSLAGKVMAARRSDGGLERD